MKFFQEKQPQDTKPLRIIVDSSRIDSALSDIAGILAEFNVKRGPERGQASKGGKYTTLKLPVTFDDRDMMERISSEISKVDSVKFLL